MNIFLNKEQRAVKRFVMGCRGNKHIIKEVKQTAYPNISAFNFTRRAFYSSEWNTLTTKARGLFIDTKNWRVVGRGFDKFFNIGERPETEFSKLFESGTLKGELSISTKANGYLGLVFVYNDKLCFAQKSRMDTGNDFVSYSVDAKKNPSFYADNFKSIFYRAVPPEQYERIKNYIKVNNITLLFEVIDMRNDPHIIEYNTSEKLVFLTAVDNSLNFSENTYATYHVNELLNTENNNRIDFTAPCYFIPEYADFDFNEFAKTRRNKCTYADINIFGRNLTPVEGYVITDKYGNRVKYKTTYYLFWKSVRGILNDYISQVNTFIKVNDAAGLLRMKNMADLWLHTGNIDAPSFLTDTFNKPSLKRPEFMYQNIQNYLYNLKVFLIWIATNFTDVHSTIATMMKFHLIPNSLISFRDMTNTVLMGVPVSSHATPEFAGMNLDTFKLHKINDCAFDIPLEGSAGVYSDKRVAVRKTEEVIDYYRKIVE